MITRVVRLTLRPDVKSEAFEEIYRNRNPFAKGVKGCRSVKVLKDVNDERVLYTLSAWDCNEDLEAYRQSEYFAQTWPMVKALLGQKTQAFSMTEMEVQI